MLRGIRRTILAHLAWSGRSNGHRHNTIQYRRRHGALLVLQPFGQHSPIDLRDAFCINWIGLPQSGGLFDKSSLVQLQVGNATNNFSTRAVFSRSFWHVGAKGHRQRIIELSRRQALDCMSGITIVEDNSRTNQTRLLKDMVPLIRAQGTMLLRIACAQHNLGGDCSCQGQAHLMRHVRLPEKWIYPTQPQVVGQCILGHGRLLAGKRLLAVRANQHRHFSTNSCSADAAFVQQHKLALPARSHIHSRSFQFLQWNQWPPLMIAINAQQLPDGFCILHEILWPMQEDF